jgi:hypothetical protein
MSGDIKRGRLRPSSAKRPSTAGSSAPGHRFSSALLRTDPEAASRGPPVVRRPNTATGQRGDRELVLVQTPARASEHSASGAPQNPWQRQQAAPRSAPRSRGAAGSSGSEHDGERAASGKDDETLAATENRPGERSMRRRRSFVFGGKASRGWAETPPAAGEPAPDPLASLFPGSLMQGGVRPLLQGSTPAPCAARRAPCAAEARGRAPLRPGGARPQLRGRCTRSGGRSVGMGRSPPRRRRQRRRRQQGQTRQQAGRCRQPRGRSGARAPRRPAAI